MVYDIWRRTFYLQTRKIQAPWTPQSFFLFFYFLYFPQNLSNFQPNLDPWTWKFEMTSKISTLLPVNESKNINTMYYSMVISCSTCQKKEKECTRVKYLIYAVLSRFQICHIFFLRQICIPKIKSSQKKALS